MCAAVVVGFDRNINYYKIQYAQLCINENPGCEFIATNLDAVTHLTDAQVRPFATICLHPVRSSYAQACSLCRIFGAAPHTRLI